MRQRIRLLVVVFVISACAFLAPQPPSHAMGRGQAVWFAPLDSYYRDWIGYAGSADFWKLFTPWAPWKHAASHVTVFKLYSSPLVLSSDDQLQRLFADLRRRGIALAMEWGPLTPVPLTPASCGWGIEGFSAGNLPDAARRIRSLGGELRYLTMDEPFYYGSLYDGNGACHWSAQQIAENAAQNLALLRAEFPDIEVGDEEPVPVLLDVPDWLERYAEWVDAFAAATGRSLAFFHADVSWVSPFWAREVAALNAVAADKGVPFGVIYNGTYLEESDREWIQRAEEHFVDYELHGGPTPAQAVFQSWNPHPTRVLPETSPEAFTFLINRYFRQRTLVTLQLFRRWVWGRLTDVSGQGIASAPLTFTVTQASGVHTITGTVPVTARSALVGLRAGPQARINMECPGCAGASDVLLRAFRYIEGTTPARQVDLNFGAGLAGWEYWGSGQFQIQSIDSPPYQALHVLTQPTEDAGLNSVAFDVTPGAPFSYEISATISPESYGSGNLTIIFLSAAGEVSRESTFIQPARVEVARTRTGWGGWYLRPLPEMPEALALTASYPGSPQHWPADRTVNEHPRADSAIVKSGK